MKIVLLSLISIYQVFLAPLLRQIVIVPTSCRYQPTCSEYAKTKIAEYGMMRGSKMALTRLLSCHPFAKSHGKYL